MLKSHSQAYLEMAKHIHKQPRVFTNSYKRIHKQPRVFTNNEIKEKLYLSKFLIFKQKIITDVKIKITIKFKIHVTKRQ